VSAELEAAHRASGALVTLAARRCEDVRGAVVLVLGADGRVVGVQIDPHPDEALSDVVATGAAIAEPEAAAVVGFEPADWAREALRTLLEHDVAVFAHVES
jgi:mannose-1-phosphate guanylyltransferase/phosphomannomutase